MHKNFQMFVKILLPQISVLLKIEPYAKAFRDVHFSVPTAFSGRSVGGHRAAVGSDSLGFLGILVWSQRRSSHIGRGVSPVFGPAGRQSAIGPARLPRAARPVDWVSLWWPDQGNIVPERRSPLLEGERLTAAFGRWRRDRLRARGA
jgi:hypothetical protein